MTPEGRVKERIKKWFKTWFAKAFIYMPVMTRFGKRGAPDFIVCLPIVVTQDMVGEEIGLFVGIEAKTEKGRMSDSQREKKKDILKAEGVYFTVYGLKDVEPKLDQLRALL
jgi:hypothetical protein